MSFVQVPPDSTGKKIATNQSGSGEEMQIVNLADASGNAIAPLTDAQLRAAPLPMYEDANGNDVTPLVTENGAVAVGNAIRKFRDGFADLAQGAAPNPANWDVVYTNQNATSAARAGNAVGSSYMRLTLDPVGAGTEVTLTSVEKFKLPIRFITGYSLSQRILGQEYQVAIVGCDADGVVDTIPTVADKAISGTVSVTTNVATINFATAHGLRGGDRVELVGNTDPRINVGPVLVTVVTATQITVPLTLANGTYTAGGVVRWCDPFEGAYNAVGFVHDAVAATQGQFAARRNGSAARQTLSTIINTAATQSNTSPYTDAFNAVSQLELYVTMQEALYVSRATDLLAAPGGNGRFSQGIPDEEKFYKIQLRAKHLGSAARPVARIVSIAKTGTTTATVTTDVPHGLTTSSFVQIHGVRDQTNFPNLTAATAVASTPTTTTFTIVIGTASTSSSAGGTVVLNQGSNTAAGIGAITQVANSISRTNGVLTVVGNTTWTGLLPGETVRLYGCDATSMGLYDGIYRVLRLSTTSLELESPGGDFTTINCGGAVFKCTDFRIHYVSQMEHTRHVMEMQNSHGALDLSRSIPVGVASGTLSTVTTVTTVSAVTAANLAIPGIIADVASAALTTTTTTAALTPTFGTTYIVSVPVTVVTGTNPTLDIGAEESDDTGTNWFRVYDFPRITTTGIYRSPPLTLRGNRVRYVQTVGGTTPSFTRAINRLQRSDDAPLRVQFIDRTIVPNTLNSTTPTYYVGGCVDYNFKIRCTAQTTPATLTVQFSDTGAASDWHTTTNTLATVNGIAHIKVQNEQWNFARLIVTAAGTGITLGEATIVGVGA